MKEIYLLVVNDNDYDNEERPIFASFDKSVVESYVNRIIEIWEPPFDYRHRSSTDPRECQEREWQISHSEFNGPINIQYKSLCALAHEQLRAVLSPIVSEFDQWATIPYRAFIVVVPMYEALAPDAAGPG